MKPISAVYDHAVEKGYLADDGGLSFLDDIAEGYVKDGHTEHADLTAWFVAAVRALDADSAGLDRAGRTAPEGGTRGGNRLDEGIEMSKFSIEVGTIPGNISEFHGPAHLRAGDPALVIRHPDAPWTSTFYATPLEDDPRVEVLGTHAVGAIGITVGLTTSKGSTVLADGTVSEWERPAIAYYSPSKLESLGEGDGVTNFADSVLYLWPKHKGAA